MRTTEARAGEPVPGPPVASPDPANSASSAQPCDILSAMQSIAAVKRRLAAREKSLDQARERLANSTPGSPGHRRASLDVKQLESAVRNRKDHLAKLVAGEPTD